MTTDGDATGPAGPTPTHDPSVFIEEEGAVGGEPYTQYRCAPTGRRWRVIGRCARLGRCIVGAVDVPPGDRPDRLDIPVTPEFAGCCPFAYEELPPGVPAP